MARHYEQKGFESHAVRTTNEQHGFVLDNYVISCVDIVLTYKGKVLLGKRDQLPQQDWWIIGGRMEPGESFEEAAKRNVARELDITIDSDRFKLLTVYSTVWSMRAQAPQGNGSHTISIVMTVEISDWEKESIRHNDEYGEIQWIDSKEVLEGDFHLAVKQCMEALQSSCPL